VESGPSFLILGLGNPGRRYAATRHNFGFFVVDELAARAGVALREGPGPSRIAPLTIGGARGWVAEPMTFMNRSGLAAVALRDQWEGPAIDRVLVVADDLDLPLGSMRFRKSGGNGGHNGLRSLIAELGTRDFPRLRLGIGRPATEAPDVVIDFVLEPFDPEEREVVGEVVNQAVEGVRTFVQDGIDAAMNRFNTGGGRGWMHPQGGGQSDP